MCLKDGIQSVLNINQNDTRIPLVQPPAYKTSYLSYYLKIITMLWYIYEWSEALECWNSLNGEKIPPDPIYQKNWDSDSVNITEELEFETDNDEARFGGLQEREWP